VTQSWSPMHAAGCQQCGAVPTAMVSGYEVTGFLIITSSRKVVEAFCRDCGQSVLRRLSATTMVGAWWGFPCGAVGAVFLFMNVFELSRLGRLEAPRGGDPTRRLDPGPALLRRPQAVGLVVPGAVLLLGLWLQYSIATFKP
jgi:hypothetical protein